METMKKEWGKPLTDVQKFVPQYCQTPCGDGTTMVTYEFWCNAGTGSYYVWLDNNIIGGDAEGDWSTSGGHYHWVGADEYLGSYHPCNATHSVTVPKGTSIDNVFPLGLMSKNYYGAYATQVRVWRGDDGKNIHCTTKLNTSEYTPHNPS